MSESNQRSYSCKDEDLPIIGALILQSFSREKTIFILFSNRFADPFEKDLKAELVNVNELVSPESEALLKKKITQQIYIEIALVDSMADPLKAYVDLTKSQLTPASFGIIALRAACNNGDITAVIDKLKVVNTNITNHLAQLKEAGLTDEKVSSLKTKVSLLTDLKTQQQDISSNRALIVQENIGQLNSFYDKLADILLVGKTLFKDNPAKLKEFTFSALKSQVGQSRSTKKNDSTKTDSTTTTTKTES